MNALEIIEIVSMIFTIITGQIGVICVVWYFYKRNLYVQKTIYMNDQLKNLKGDSFESFSIGKFISFRPHLSFEEHYPPPVNSQYLKNLAYNKLQNNFYKLGRKLERTAKVSGLVYVIVMILLGLLYLFL